MQSKLGIAIVWSFLALILAALLAWTEWGGGTLLLVAGSSAAALAAGWALVKRGPK